MIDHDPSGMKLQKVERAATDDQSEDASRLASKSTETEGKVNKISPKTSLRDCIFARRIAVSARKNMTCDESQIGL